MQMALPIFFIFTIYAVNASQLPLFFVKEGYSITEVGILLAVFECFGTFCTFLLSPYVERQKNYGIPLLISALLTLVLPFFFLGIHSFIIASVCLGIYAIGYRGLIPLSDAMVNRVLGSRSSDYGKVRAIGSFSYVVMQVVLQIFSRVQNESVFQMMLWMAVPALLTCASFFAVPGLISGTAPEYENTAVPKKERGTLKEELTGFPAEFWMGILVTFAAFLGTAPLGKFLSLYVTDSLHVDAAPVLWAVSAASEIPFMFFSGHFIRKYGSSKLLFVSTGVITIRMIVYVVFPSFGGALAGQLLNSITYGVFHPAAIAFISEHCPADKRITGLSLYSILSSGLASIIGSAVGGIIIDHFGYQALFLSFAVPPVIGLTVFAAWRKNHRC